MALDGLSLNAVVRELTVLKGAKIEKAAQPDRDTLLFLLHAQNHTRLRLLYTQRKRKNSAYRY